MSFKVDVRCTFKKKKKTLTDTVVMLNESTHPELRVLLWGNSKAFTYNREIASLNPGDAPGARELNFPLG